MTPATLWFRFDHQTGAFEVNHLGDGHETTDRPAPRHPEQVRSWSGGRWERKHVWLTADLPPRLVAYSNEELS